LSLGSRKAVSPLIAAVLLVVITVSIGAVVMTLVRTYMTEGEQQVTVGKEAIKCGRDVSVGLALVDGNYMICNGTNADDSNLASLNFYLENTGTIDVLDAQVRLVGNKGIFQNDSVLNGTLKTGGTQLINMSYDPDNVGEFRQVKIVPRINLPGITEHAYCSDSGVTITSIPNNCTSYQ
jgi:flagellin-like protein